MRLRPHWSRERKKQAMTSRNKKVNASDGTSVNYTKYLLGFSLLNLVSLSAAVVFVGSPRSTPAPEVSQIANTSTAAPAFVSSKLDQEAPVAVQGSVEISPPSSAGTEPVRDADLLALARAVGLGNEAKAVHPDKEAWARQMSVAQNLYGGICDCEQRNWLSNFITTANYAVSGSDAFNPSVQHLAQMPHNNKELAAQIASVSH
jgi:hypothetical protein